MTMWRGRRGRRRSFRVTIGVATVATFVDDGRVIMGIWRNGSLHLSTISSLDWLE